MPRGRGTHKTALNDLSGQQINHWTVLGRAANRPSGRTAWNCRCVCGTEKVVVAIHLRSGGSKSCGCVRPRGQIHSNFKHGQSSSITHNSWAAMNTRCKNPSNRMYHRYGGIGVVVCERWKDFSNFLADMGERPSPKHSLGRIDGSKGYEPGNCEWQTARQQANNTTRNVFITINGERRTLAEWCRIRSLNYSVVKYRLTAGWDTERALA